MWDDAGHVGGRNNLARIYNGGKVRNKRNEGKAIWHCRKNPKTSYFVLQTARSY